MTSFYGTVSTFTCSLIETWPLDVGEETEMRTVSFLCYRENLEWLARATNWAKFTATASLGVIHKVNIIIRSRHFSQIGNRLVIYQSVLHSCLFDLDFCLFVCLRFLFVCFRFVCFLFEIYVCFRFMFVCFRLVSFKLLFVCFRFLIICFRFLSVSNCLL